MAKISAIILSCFSFVQADVRIEAMKDDDFAYLRDNIPFNRAADGSPITGFDAGHLRYRYPSIFGYRGIYLQTIKNNDQYLRSNCDNQANKRNPRTEPAVDMLPCRQPDRFSQKPMKYHRGETVMFPVEWNNPHNSDCEFNFWNEDMSRVAPIAPPRPCGGGYKKGLYPFRIPKDVAGCEDEDNFCTLQFYGHSVETRTYAICVNFYLAKSPAPIQVAEGNATSLGFPRAVWRQPKLYWDSYDTSHYDSDYSGYRGQQEDLIRDEVKAAIQLRSYIHNGGLVKNPSQEAKRMREIRKSFKDKVEQAIKDAEAIAIEKNQAEQAKMPSGQCFEAKKFGAVVGNHCHRQYTNTYVTNVGYRAIFEKFEPQFKNASIIPYQPKRKTILGTPHDPVGQYLVNGRPSQVPSPHEPRFRADNIGDLQYIAYGQTKKRKPPALLALLK